MEEKREKTVDEKRDDALRRALFTPPKPKTESAKRKDKTEKNATVKPRG